MIPLFDWPVPRPKCFKNYVTKNPELAGSGIAVVTSTLKYSNQRSKDLDIALLFRIRNCISVGKLAMTLLNRDWVLRLNLA